MERQRFGNRVVIGRRMRADLFELADVLHLTRGRRRQRPQLLNVLAADVQEAGADRREQPLVERGPVVVDLEIAQLEREMREGVRAVDDRLNPAAARHARDVAHREELSGEVRDVTEVNDLRLRRDGALDAILQLRDVGGRHRERDLRQLDLVAAYALLPCVDHAAVVLVRRQYLVARVQIDAELCDLKAFARVTRDGELLGVAAGLGREVAPHGFDVRLEQVPHVVNGRLVRHVEIPLERLVNHTRARTGVAVVEIDDRAIQRESLLNLTPVALVSGEVRGGPVGYGAGRRDDPLQPVRLQPDQTRGAGRNDLSQKVTSSLHESLPNPDPESLIPNP